MDAQLIARDDGFYVLAGSVCAPELSEAGKKNSTLVNMREKLQQTGVLKQQGEKLVFTQDYKFSSPSGASTLVYGRNMNGWEWWRNASGKTLNECIRQSEKEERN